MDKALIVYEENAENSCEQMIRMIEEAFSDRQIKADRICIKENSARNDYLTGLTESMADYICTLDMAGFQLDTLLNMPVYNIIEAKQLHIVINEEVLPVYANNQFALNLFLFVPDDAEKWRKKYQHIPYIESYERLETDERGRISKSPKNGEILETLIKRLICESQEQVKDE